MDHEIRRPVTTKADRFMGAQSYCRQHIDQALNSLVV